MARSDGSETEGGSAADLTLRLLREMRAKMATKEDLAKLRVDTKEDLREARGELGEEIAKLRRDFSTDVGKLEARMNARFDVLTRVIKDNYRVFARRIRAVELRTAAR